MILIFWAFPNGRAAMGFAAATVLRQATHWLTPPSASLTRFATQTKRSNTATYP
ncbi:MAG: hypothetical protein JNM36_15510 [Chitinophagales bacterium]|nr:hypothetical protein [Chitinophagales bacterium]